MVKSMVVAVQKYRRDSKLLSPVEPLSSQPEDSSKATHHPWFSSEPCKSFILQFSKGRRKRLDLSNVINMQAATAGRADQRATHHPWCSSKFYSAFSQESNEEADLSNVIKRQAATSRKTHQRSDNCVRLIIRHACSFLCMMNAKFVLNPIHKFNFCTNPNVIFVDEKQGSDIPMLHLACLFWPGRTLAHSLTFIAQCMHSNEEGL